MMKRIKIDPSLKEDNRFDFPDEVSAEIIAERHQYVDAVEYVTINSLNQSRPEEGAAIDFELPQRHLLISNHNKLRISGNIQKRIGAVTAVNADAAHNIAAVTGVVQGTTWIDCVSDDYKKFILNENFASFLFPKMDLKSNFNFTDLEGFIPGGRALYERFTLRHMDPKLLYLYGPQRLNDPANFVVLNDADWNNTEPNGMYMKWVKRVFDKGPGEGFAINFCPNFFLFQSGPRIHETDKILPFSEHTMTLHLDICKNTNHIITRTEGVDEYRIHLSAVSLMLAVPRLSKLGLSKLNSKSGSGLIPYPGKTIVQHLIYKSRAIGRSIEISNQPMPEAILVECFNKDALLGRSQLNAADVAAIPACRNRTLDTTNVEFFWDGKKFSNDVSSFAFGDKDMQRIRDTEFRRFPISGEPINLDYHFEMANYNNEHLLYNFYANIHTKQRVRAVGQDKSSANGTLLLKISSGVTLDDCYLVTVIYSSYVLMDYKKRLFYNSHIRSGV